MLNKYTGKDGLDRPLLFAKDIVSAEMVNKESKLRSLMTLCQHSFSLSPIQLNLNFTDI